MTHTKEYARIREAYFTMAEQARFRPAAPNDGFGNGDLTEEQLTAPAILEEEAERFVLKFTAEETTAQFWIGVSDLSTSKALVYVIEAARCLCSGQITLREIVAPRLLELAMDDLASYPKDKVQSSF